MIVENESKILATIQHPYVVKMIDNWEKYDAYNYVLEYLKGEDLGVYMKQKGPLKEKPTQQIIRKILLSF